MKQATTAQAKTIDKILELWWKAYGREPYDEFVVMFFQYGGKVHVPENIDMSMWIFNAQIEPPDWLINRVVGDSFLYGVEDETI